MSKSKLRPVEFTNYYVDSVVRGFKEPREGLFHQWGEIIAVDNDKYFSITVAVAEDQEGQVYMVMPQTMRFTDTNKADKGWAMGHSS